ncbi:MAG: hypothetical protein DCC43_04195 [Candidatus Brocadia sp.]|jgi:mono/diheme cytochrome c family protein|uniref:Cytochrome c domain-containing protein n=1 Tax=Candidatus Brocadia fulgida TaxID=380242 RepID=A0A0M2UW77_9BACT|nr:MAG: hypothetical protein BROFUL_02534 [Candidatus Brocadia fulgida]MCC6324655.1 cytochrome c [Candidatus Brocadia sp.]MCE7910957.1 hypothetical protein [Candidatus Brocadia sp. AMX3]OQZ00565.1 MAG: hypothetical protein B6D35_06205 [Candidatus Brocadia sp. UTAMX2]MBV6517759.1 hypothetical protein [Candidatus Brocadia fulgida]
MGYFMCWKKFAVNTALVFGVIGWFATANGAEVSPRDQIFLLSPKKTFDYYCSPCHGLKGKGDGTFFTIDLKPKPRNFTDLDYMKKRTDDQLIKSITDGSKSVDKSNLCPPWGKTLTDKKIKELVAYIRGLATQESAAPVAVAKGPVSVDEKESPVKAVMRWGFIAVITIALASGAISEWKKLRNESPKG